MFRNTLILITLATAALQAGQIQLSGTATNVNGFGLTGTTATGAPGYIQGPGPGVTNCAGAQNGSPCATAVTSNARKGNYVTQLFAGATGLSTPAPDAFLNQPSASGQLTSSTLKASDGTFVKYDLMNAQNGSNGYSGATTCALCIDANFWSSASQSGNLVDLVIPVGLFNVDAVSTMLNDYWGTSNAQNITLNFCFSATSNGACTIVAVALNNGVEVRSAVNAANPGNAIASGPLAASTANVNGSGVTVKTGTVYTATFTSIPSTVPTGAANPSPFAGATSGTVNLDEQQFIFTTAQYQNKYLSYIEVLDPNIVQNSASGSRFALSAVTISQTPEPSTILLFAAGLGVIGMGRLRRRA